MSFKNYLKKLDLPGVIFSFGRFNPMHEDHYQLTKDMQDYAKKNKTDAILFTSFAQNQKKNPLYPNDKIYFLKEMVPKNVKVSEDTSLKTAFQILENLIKNKHYKRIIFMVGEDRYNDFQSLKKYAKQWGDDIDETIEFSLLKRKGQRKKGYSGTDMRNYAKENDFEKFKKHAPSSLTNQQIQELFEKVQIGLGI